MASARRTGTHMWRGIYVGVNGPELETSAERRFFRSAGGDAVGMSTVIEVIAANHAGMKVLGLSAIANAATGGADQQPDTVEIGHSDGRLVRRQDCRGACRSVAETAGRDLSFPGRLDSQGLRLGATNGFVSVDSVFFV